MIGADNPDQVNTTINVTPEVSLLPPPFFPSPTLLNRTTDGFLIGYSSKYAWRNIEELLADYEQSEQPGITGKDEGKGHSRDHWYRSGEDLVPLSSSYNQDIAIVMCGMW